MMKVFLKLCLLFVLTLSVSSVFAQVIYVKHDAIGVNNGSSWTDAYVNLQDAINAANSTDQIWVARGAYLPTQNPVSNGTDRDKTFILNKGVSIYGGFVGDESAEFVLENRNLEENPTVLSGDLGARCDYSDNVYHVLFAQGATGLIILDGFTVTGGNADGVGTANIGGSFSRANGGGMVIRASNVTLNNIRFRDNHAPPVLPVSANVSLGNGGAIHVATGTTSSPSIVSINGGVFEKNTAYRGGTLHIAGNSTTVTINESSFADNTTTEVSSFGAAIHIPSGKLDIVNTSFINNRAGGTGGAIYQSGANTEVNIIRSKFLDNRSSGSGGAACFANGTVNISSSLFSGNMSTHTGNGLGAGAINSSYCVRGYVLR